MKIAFVSDAAYPWNVGGLETIERVEAESLAKDHELHFFSLRWPGMRREFKQDGIHYHAFNSMTKERFYRHGRRSIREAIIFSIGTLRIFGYRFDVIQANQFPVLHLPILKAYCKLTGCKLIIDVHEVWDRAYWTTYLGSVLGNLANFYAGLAFKHADYYIANSSTTSKKLIEITGPERVRTFSPILDDRELKKVPDERTKKQIVFAGRLIKEKRLDRWLEVVRNIRKTVRVKGLIIGEGPEEGSLRKMIKSMSLERVVELRGFYKDKKAMYKKIKESSLLLHMSEREGLSIITLESLALGTPVLLPDYSPIPDEIRDMCVVGKYDNLSSAAGRILKGPKYKYIRNAGNMERFYISKLKEFYVELFRGMDMQKRKRGI